MLRFLFWRVLGLLAMLAGLALAAWCVGGGPGRVLRGADGVDPLGSAVSILVSAPGDVAVPLQIGLARWLAWLAPALGALVLMTRLRARGRRRYVRLWVEAYRADRSSAEAVVRMFEALHKRLLRRWWRRLLHGQPSVALEVHYACTPQSARLAVSCPRGLERMVEAALQCAYPNCRVRAACQVVCLPPTLLRLKKQGEFIKRVKALDHFEHEREPPVNRLITVMGACAAPAVVQVAMTPTPASFERFAKRLYKRREAHLSRERREHLAVRDRSLVEDAELRGGLDVQHRPLFFADVRVMAPTREICERIASELRADGAENRLVERGTKLRQGLLGIYGRRLERGEGNPLPSFRKGAFASTELAGLWQLPSLDYMTVPFARSALPLAPAPPAVLRPAPAQGSLRDALGPVSIHPELRKQNTAVPGTVEQGKSSYLVATVAEDLQRDRCAVIVLDPKGDAADAALSLVPVERTCTLLDFSHPTCGFNPLAVDAPADVIADYVVGALKNLYTDNDIRASSDRYLRNAIIAVLAYDRHSTLWDAARLLSVGEEGYSYRNSVGGLVRALPEFKEISEFFTGELSAQLADARSTTTAKLDAPVNKLARLLNSPSIKRVLMNDSLTVDFNRVIEGEEVLVVKGALGAMGAGNTSVLMQLLVGMLDAALARQQDLVPEHRRVTVALKVDEAPLVLNRGFAETLALKRSAGLETVASWQADAQWSDREVRDQLDALFAHRVYFATASGRDARAAVELTMAEFSDTVRPGIERLSSLGHPDVRLRLPKHHAIVSWSTPEGRQAPFIAQTFPFRIDRERLAFHAARQLERGARHRSDLRQPHWDRRRPSQNAGPQGALQGARQGARPPDSHRSPMSAAVSDAANISLPTITAGSYRELVELDGASSVRWAKRVPSPRALVPDPLDLQMLALIAALRHVLTSQLHRHFNHARAVTTTQRRLKRLSDVGLLERFQFHRRDGGGVPMCYVITAAGLQLLRDSAQSPRDSTQSHFNSSDGLGAARVSATAAGERRLRQARHDVHVAGWALALAQLMRGARPTVRGSDESVLSPRLRPMGDRRVALTPADLRLPGGRTPHDFLRSDATGERVAVESFETLRPDAVVAVATQAPGVDLMIELDDRLASARAPGKLERYDHFLAGWSAHTGRYGRRREAVPVVVFVCRDRARARECARRSDSLLGACRAYPGEYPFDWEYPGRERVLFASERDIHEGLLCACGVPRLPPEVRVLAARGDPRAAETAVEPKQILQAAHTDASGPTPLQR